MTTCIIHKTAAVGPSISTANLRYLNVFPQLESHLRRLGPGLWFSLASSWACVRYGVSSFAEDIRTLNERSVKPPRTDTAISLFMKAKEGRA